jgi:hypothetical protein
VRLRIIFMATGRPQGEDGSRVTMDVPAKHRFNCYIYVYHLVHTDVFVGRTRQAVDFGGNSTEVATTRTLDGAAGVLFSAIPHSPDSYIIVDTNVESHKYV